MKRRMVLIVLLAVGIMGLGWGFHTAESMSTAVSRAPVRLGTDLSGVIKADTVQPLSGSSAFLAGLTVIGPALDAGIWPLR